MDFMSLLEQEETYWRSRCHEQWLLGGDNNTSYFHKIANGRKRKNTVITLENNGDIIEGNENLLAHATEYSLSYLGLKQTMISILSKVYGTSCLK